MFERTLFERTLFERTLFERTLFERRLFERRLVSVSARFVFGRIERRTRSVISDTDSEGSAEV